jgi:hypothetical protein
LHTISTAHEESLGILTVLFYSFLSFFANISSSSKKFCYNTVTLLSVNTATSVFLQLITIILNFMQQHQI